MKKNQGYVKHFISKAKKGRLTKEKFKGEIRYLFDANQRKFILNKLDDKYRKLAYNIPLPRTEGVIASEVAVFSGNTTLVNELKWFFEVFFIFNDQLNRFSKHKSIIETNILLGNTIKVDSSLEKIENEICCSLYSLIIELYLNEQENERAKNEKLNEELEVNGMSSKLPVIVDFAKYRVEKDLQTWRYDTYIEHHKSLYSEDAKYIIDYIVFKFDPLNFDYVFENKAFLINFESDFSVIDRRNSIQALLPLVIHTLSVNELEELLPEIKKIAIYSKDLYWNRILFFLDSNNYKNLQLFSNQKVYDNIADLFFDGKYLQVAKLTASCLQVNPEIQELHIFFVRALIFIKKEVSEFLNKDNVLFQILTLMKSVLLKDEDYSTNRDKLLEEYYKNSFFNFSNCLLQDIYYEFQFDMPQTVYSKIFFSSSIISNRSIQLFEGNGFINFPNFSDSIWEIFVRKALTIDNHKLDFSKFHQVELYVISKINIGHFNLALTCLNNFYRINEYSELPEFVKTWYIRNKIKCYYELELIGEAINLIVEEYFRSKFFYEHYYCHDILNYLIENDDSNVYKEISIPIFFQITKQTKSLCYDSIANFLLQHKLYCPSELEEYISNFDKKLVIYFLENCCTKSNIEDSPFINSIDSLSLERISILNCLKRTNPEKIKMYNEEILSITKEDRIRKGVKHIHESRIFVDTESLIKILNTDLTEIFDRYLSLDNSRHSTLSTMTMDEVYNPNKIDSMFYCLESVDEDHLKMYLLKEPIDDPNIVRVPLIRYTYFTMLFEEIKDIFIFSEDFGFKSFLSMRIRHGTFSNVLRNVFDKFNLIASKESSGDKYKEIKYWNQNKIIPDKFKNQCQNIFKSFSRLIDDQIDLGLSWIKVYEQEDDHNAMFNFVFSDLEMKAIFINKIGGIDKPEDFILEVFSILFDRLDTQLNAIRLKIDTQLSEEFVEIIEQMEVDVATIYGKSNKLSLLQEQIIDCKTEIQLVTNQVQNWFKVSRNHYVEEFPIEMILETSIDYTNSINGNILSIANVKRNINCNSKYKGKYFEGFGDMLINIFDNIIKNNKDLNTDLKIAILIESDKGLTRIAVSNNLSPNIDMDELNHKIKDIKRKVNNYKEGNMASSFEGDSGYLKICRCISADLEQTDYDVSIECSDNKYEIQITIENKNLIS